MKWIKCIKSMLFFMVIAIGKIGNSMPMENMQHHSTTSENVITIAPERLKNINMTSTSVKSQWIEKTIHTVGNIDVDERLVAHVHVRFDGWIEKLWVNYIGEKVKKGQALFTVYSPDLVSAEQEYLLALQAKNMLGGKLQSSLEAAKQKLLLLGISEEAIKSFTQTGNITHTMTINSPIHGTVIDKMALAGMRIQPDDTLYTIADLSRLWILGDIYEYELPYIQRGQMADVTLSYLPNHVFKARLDFIYPTIDKKTRTAKVRFVIDNTNGQLKPGMYTNIDLKIPLGKRLVVPENAVLITGERAVVFINHGDGKIEWRNVTLGVRVGDLIEVVTGLKEGDNVITSANFLIDSESQLKAAMGGMHG